MFAHKSRKSLDHAATNSAITQQTAVFVQPIGASHLAILGNFYCLITPHPSTDLRCVQALRKECNDNGHYQDKIDSSIRDR